MREDDAIIDDGSDKPEGYTTPDGELTVVNGEYHETEMGQSQRWMRQAPDLYEKILGLEGNVSNGGAVDMKECPGWNRCTCGKCAICGFPKHSAIHGPAYGQPPGSKPWGHEFKPPAEGRERKEGG